MGQIRITTIDPPRSNDLHGRLGTAHMTDLYGRGMRAQQVAAHLIFHVKRVVHCTRGMVLGNVQGSNIVEIGLDLGTEYHVKPKRVKQGAYPFRYAGYGMQASSP